MRQRDLYVTLSYEGYMIPFIRKILDYILFSFVLFNTGRMITSVWLGNEWSLLHQHKSEIWYEALVKLSYIITIKVSLSTSLPSGKYVCCENHKLVIPLCPWNIRWGTGKQYVTKMSLLMHFVRVTHTIMTWVVVSGRSAYVMQLPSWYMQRYHDRTWVS